MQKKKSVFDGAAGRGKYRDGGEQAMQKQSHDNVILS